MKNYTCAVLLLCFIPLTLHAEWKSYSVGKKKVQLDLPQNWVAIEKSEMIDLAVVGPEVESIGVSKKKRRPVVLFTYIGDSEGTLRSKKTKEALQSYKAGRLAFLDQISAKLVKFYDYKAYTWPNVSEAHRLGFEYQLGEEVLSEKTYYIKCGNSFFHTKLQIGMQHRPLLESEAISFIRGLKCD